MIYWCETASKLGVEQSCEQVHPTQDVYHPHAHHLHGDGSACPDDHQRKVWWRSWQEASIALFDLFSQHEREIGRKR